MARTVGIEVGGAPSMATPPAAGSPAEEPGAPPVGEAKTTPALSMLAAHVRVVFEEAANHRKATGVDDRLDELLRMSVGKYSTWEEAEIRATGAPLVYIPVADKKHRAGAAMLGELFNNPGDKCWTLVPTPDPTVPKWVRERAIAEVVAPFVELWTEEHGAPPPKAEVWRAVLKRADEIDSARRAFALRAARGMEERIHDQMVEGGWIEALNRYVDDLCIYGTAFLRGPEPRMRRTVEYASDEKAPGGKVRVVEDVALSFEAVSPFDVYPAPGARDVNDGPLVLKVRYLPDELRLASRLPEAKGGRKGWIPEAVDSILRSTPQGGGRDWLAETTRSPDRESPDGAKQDTSARSASADCTIEGLEFFGSVRGSELLGIGMRELTDGEAVDPAEYYEVDAIVINDVVVHCRIVEPEIGRPVCKGVFYPRSDSYWGVGPMEKCKDAQRMCNAAVRSLGVNMPQASGPQFAITDMGRLDPTCGTDLTPWKMWRFGPPPFGQGGNANPIQMFQPASNAAELIKVEEYFDKLCDELSGIPAYTMGQGTAAGEIGRTASGYSMLMESATRGFKHAVHQTDVLVVRRMVMMCYAWEMLHGKDETVKGDVRCNPAGLVGLINKEQDYNRKMQFLQLTANPIDQQLVGLAGRAKLLREIARPMEISLDEVLKSPEKLEEEQRLAELRQKIAVANEAAGALGPQPGAAPAPAEAGGEEDFRGASGGRRATVPQPGIGITPQARGAMRKAAGEPRARAAQGLRAAQTRAARRASA